MSEQTTMRDVTIWAGQLNDAAKLRLLADWFDAKYPDDRAQGTDDVQRDLRRIASQLEHQVGASSTGEALAR